MRRTPIKALAFVFSLCLPIQSVAAAETFSAHWVTETPLDSVRPQIDPWTFSWQIHGDENHQLEGRLVHIVIKAPSSSLWMSTDFPRVEGTILLDSVLPLEASQVRIAWIPPIRGTYQISASIVGDAEKLLSKSVWEPHIGENPEKLKNLAVFLAIIAVLAIISGAVIGYTRPSSLTHVSLGLALTLSAAINFCPRVFAHGDDHFAHENQLRSIAGSDPITGQAVALQILSEHPRVGELALLKVQASGSNGQALGVHFDIRILQLEHNVEVFHTEASAPNGSLQWRFQFYDGSTHRVLIRAVPLDGSPVLQTQADVEVEGIAPPLMATAKAFGLLLGLVSLAVGLGLWLGLQWREKRELAA